MGKKTIADLFRGIGGFRHRANCLGLRRGFESDAGERCSAASNRNFESRQGSKGRTYSVAPAMAAAATARLTDVWEKM